jgi:hypothetical protein
LNGLEFLLDFFYCLFDLSGSCVLHI